MLQNLDKKRVLIALLILAITIGGSAVWAKNNLPKILSQKQTVSPHLPSNSEGEVSGSQDSRLEFDKQREDLQKQIEEIKKDIAKLKPEDIKEQEPVKKILNDLDDLRQKALDSTKVFDVKGNLCEEAKKRFCE